jgi:hypothetical protein
MSGTTARIITVALVALAVWLVAAAGASAFTAGGSVKQVYATGLPANAPTTLLNGSGGAVQTKTTDEQGGVLFREVSPGPRYRVRLDSNGETSAAVAVHSAAAAPWDPESYNQEDA